LKQPFETMPTVLNAEEIISKAVRDAEREEVELSDRVPAIIKAKKREAARIRAAEKASAGYLESLVKTVPTIDNLHPFYMDVLEVLVGIAEAKAALGRLSRSARIIREAARSSLSRLRRPKNPKDAASARRAFIGRMASIVRGAAADLETVAKLRERMKDLPAADPAVPTVVLAGYPGVGKSTIVRAISSAKPETRVYPFTTQAVIVGHAKIGGMTVQMVDTPGLLDRPIERMNKTELLAITALSKLSSVVAFIVDVSEANAFTIDRQKALYDGVRESFPQIPFLVFFNKADAADQSQIARAESLFGKRKALSALTGDGLGSFISEVEGALKELYPA